MATDMHIHIAAGSKNAQAIERLAARERTTPERIVERILDEGIRRQLDPDNYDHLFTPEVVADLRSIAAEMESGGRVYSGEEIDEHFAQRRLEWLANHPS